MLNTLLAEVNPLMGSSLVPSSLFPYVRILGLPSFSPNFPSTQMIVELSTRPHLNVAMQWHGLFLQALACAGHVLYIIVMAPTSILSARTSQLS